MEWQDRTKQAIAWMGQHISDELTREDAARKASCSLCHSKHWDRCLSDGTVARLGDWRPLGLPSASPGLCGGRNGDRGVQLLRRQRSSVDLSALPAAPRNTTARFGLPTETLGLDRPSRSVIL